MIPVLWYLNDSNWDTALPKYILNEAATCQHFLGLDKAQSLGSKRCVIVIPGRHAAGEEHYMGLRWAARFFKKVIFIIIGDEEGIFHADQIRMPNAKIWWLMPPFHPKQDVDRVGPNGWPSDAIQMIAKAKSHAIDRRYDWSFQGQMTHSRRIDCVSATQDLENGILLATEGFTQGVPREEYYATMVRSKFVLCPSGPCTPDSFRFAEALEAGCVPIVDNLIQHPSYPPGYWDYVFGQTHNFPFPIIEDWSTLPAVMEESLKLWNVLAEGCAGWWALQKQMWILEMKEDLS